MIIRISLLHHCIVLGVWVRIQVYTQTSHEPAPHRHPADKPPTSHSDTLRNHNSTSPPTNRPPTNYSPQHHFADNPLTTIQQATAIHRNANPPTSPTTDRTLTTLRKFHPIHRKDIHTSTKNVVEYSICMFVGFVIGWLNICSGVMLLLRLRNPKACFVDGCFCWLWKAFETQTWEHVRNTKMLSLL